MDNQTQKIPAGIMGNIEAFVYENRKYLIIDGTRVDFEHSPGHVQRIFGNAFMADKPFRNWLKSKGTFLFSKGFDKWFFCKFGAYDGTPDLVKGRLVPDKFNHACTDYECNGRGRHCGNLSFDLKYFEVRTLQCLMQGCTAEETAEICNVSTPAIKSRVESLKQKTGARNTAHLVAKATELGIQPHS